MDIMRTIALVSAVLALIWIGVLLICLCSQVNRMRINWMRGQSPSLPPNAAIDYVIDKLGLGEFDRLNCVILITAAILAWPLTAAIGYPAISTLHARKQLKLKSGN